MSVFSSKKREIRCQTNHRWKNLTIKLTNAPVQDDIREDKAGIVKRLFGVFFGYVWESVLLLSKGKWPFQLGLQGCAVTARKGQQVPRPPPAAMCVLLQGSNMYHPQMGWARVRADFTLRFPALDPGWDFPFLAQCFSARS